MSLLEQASLVITPNAVKESKLYSVVPSDGSGDMDVVRATTATRVNSEGLIEVVPYNLLTYSNTFSNANWGKISVTVSGGQTGYDGSSNAWLLSNTATSGAYLYQSTKVDVNSIFSLYLKKGTLDFAMFLTSGSTLAIFDLLNGTIASSAGGLATIESAGNGWYKCSIKPTSTGTNVRIYPGNNAGEPVGNIFIQDAQLENSLTAKEYFPTTDRLNIPRIDYTNGSCPSILVEPQRTNLLLRSEEFDNASWNKTRSSITTNATTAPNGTLTADKLIDDTTASATHQIREGVSVSGGEYTMSIYAKKGEYNFIRFWEDGISGKQCYFDLENGVATNVNMTSVNIVNVGNGWFRCEAKLTISSGTFGFRINLTPDGTTTAYNGTGTNGVYLWGAQLEAGSYATSYIPTVATTSTRNADNISKTGISGLIGQTEGVLYANVKFNSLGTGDSWLTISSGTNANWIFIGKASNKIRAYVKGNNSVVFDNSVTNITSNQLMKIAIAYKSGNIALYINGSLIATSTNSFTFSSDLSLFALDSSSGISENISETTIYQEIILFKNRLTDTELAQLTTL